MHTNNKIKTEQKAVVVDDKGVDDGAARLMSYEQYDFQPGCRKKSVPAFPMQVDVAQPAQPVPSFFIKAELRDDTTKTGRPEIQDDNVKTAAINVREVSVRKVKTAKEEVKTCKPEADRKGGQSERRSPAARVKLSNEIVRKTVGTMKNAINTLKTIGSKEATGKGKPESSVKTALSISTIPDKEAEKYSFLKKDKKKPVALTTNFEEPHGSDLDLDLGTGIDEEKPKPPRLDMKTLEAYFKASPKCTDKKPTPPPENTDKQEKARRSKSWTARKQKSMKLLRTLTKGSSSAEKTDKSAEDQAKVKVKRSWTKRLKRKFTHQSSPVSSKQRPSKEREKSKKSLKS